MSVVPVLRRARHAGSPPKFRFVAVVALGALAGCSLAPREAARERADAESAGRPYALPAPERVQDELPPDADWRTLLRYALRNNGELEAAYFEWLAAIERIDIAATYPNTNVSLGFDYLFSGGNLTAWDRTTLTVGFDPMENLAFPTKVLAAGRVATEEARSAGQRFAATKFALQRRVLEAWLDYALLAERVRIQREQLELLDLAADTAAARVRGGAPQQELLSAEVERQHGRHELIELQDLLPQARAQLNALLGRPADAPLAEPAIPAPRPLPADDDRLLAFGTRANPTLAALARDAAGAAEALDLARQQYFPDVNPFVGFEGSIAQVVGAAITLPSKIPQIRAGIREARANLRAAEALRRQAGLERDAAFVATLIALRSSERQHALLEHHVVPAAAQAAEAAERLYTTGAGDLPTLITARRTLLELRLALAEARIARERNVATLEELAGIDAEQLVAAAAQEEVSS